MENETEDFICSPCKTVRIKKDKRICIEVGIKKDKRICIEVGCTKSACYNKEGETKRLYCASHKKEGMVNVVSKTCIEIGCKVRPTYNKEGEKKALYCSKHKKEDMLDVKNKKCIELGCKKQPNYNKEGKTKALYCVSHKKDGMVNVTSKTCIYPNCTKQPTYNKECEKKALYCSTHKLEGMFDIKHNSCIEDGCTFIPCYNTERETKGLYCFTHKKEDMIDVEHNTCIHPDCKIRPTYNKEGEKKALYCSIHKKECMVNVVSKTCNSTWCNTTTSNPKYEGYCLFCYVNMFPDKPNVRNYKTKEKDVVDRITQSFNNFTWIADKKVQDGCSKRRPDLLLDMGSHIIIVEIDENKHTDYDCSCEHKRLMELSQDLHHRPIVFIRFNPDDYTNQDDILVKSCWKLNKLGVIQIAKNKQKEWEERIETLKEQIQYWIDNPTEKTVEIIELFY
jgi:hypothetical protein